jgi:hypothetical protein
LRIEELPKRKEFSQNRKEEIDNSSKNVENSPLS